MPARWGFTKGILAGAALEVPILAGSVWLLADREIPFMAIVRLTAVFAGLAALLTAGGIGRLAAHASVRGRRRGMFVAARAHAIATIGLLIIAVIPHDLLPVTRSMWIELVGVGLVGGALTGAIVGAICSGRIRLGIAELWTVANRRTGALLGPRDLKRLGVALRARFEGIFEPDAKRPSAGAAAEPLTAEPAAEPAAEPTGTEPEPDVAPGSGSSSNPTAAPPEPPSARTE